jgi:hypothetical protein
LLLGKVAEAEKLETEVYAIAEKVLAQRPGDLRSMANRALAADFLGRLAIRRHDYVAATDYAARSALAGENYVRFNPSDLNSWVYWVRGRDQIASILLEQGHIAAAHDAFRATVALDQDPRKPASLSPLLWNNWGGLALLESRMGDFPAAESTFNSTVAAVKTTASVEAVGSERRVLFDLVVSSMQSRLNLAKGNNQGAFDLAMQTAGQLRKLDVSEAQSGGNIRDASAFRNNVLRNTLITASLAALRTGRYGEAEAAARERGSLPPNPYSELDPQDEKSRAQVTLAHAIALQGRTDEARQITQTEIARYRDELKNGANGLSFNRDLAYALYVDALARPVGDPARAAQLIEASKRLDLLSAEANQLLDIRELRAWIAAA